ncbi:MAG TPA: dihydroorotase, partial [Gammaproteobacteria bacterium]|nr:dihydroorotase [Gammaproteobacteria bacterium]
MSTLALVNARVVNEGRIVDADVLIRGERIERIGREPPPQGAEVIDLGGKHLLPGLIDDQVHCREPGLTHKAKLATESLAAICGGVTSFLDMPNTRPPTVDRAMLAGKRRIAAATCYANYGFYLGATNDNLEEIKAVGPDEACGIKVFMGAST